MLGTGMIVVGFPLAFHFSTEACKQPSQRSMGTIALTVAILAVGAAVALLLVI